MFKFLAENIPTIIAGSLVLAVLVFVALKMIKDKKKGKNSCGCRCAGCPSGGICHPK